MDGIWIETASQLARRVRRRAAQVCIANNGGYLLQACGSAEIFAALFTRLMDLGASTGPLVPVAFSGVPAPGRRPTLGTDYIGNRDRFFLSPAHYALGLYSTLCELGRLGGDVLLNANADGSTLEMIGAEHSPGFESTSGSLGQALSVAVGQALARKRFSREGHVWVLLSDGELEEGQTWEAFQAAANYELDNLTIVVDANGMQVNGLIEKIMSIEPIGQKIRAFGLSVEEVDGHDLGAIASAAETIETGKPRVVVCRTDPARGIPSLRNRHQLHYIRFREGEAESLMADLNSAVAI